MVLEGRVSLEGTPTAQQLINLEGVKWDVAFKEGGLLLVRKGGVGEMLHVQGGD